MKIAFKNQASREARTREVLGYFKRFFDQCVEHADCREDLDLALACGKGALGKDVEAVAWTQNTPAYNDNPNTFKIGRFFWKLRAPDLAFTLYHADGYSFIRENVTSPLAIVCQNFESMLKGAAYDSGGNSIARVLANEMFLDAFGDHAEVAVTREGAVIEEHVQDT